jgi:hypothetical protein
MPACPACGRPVAMARPRCLYCGGPISAHAVAEAARSAAEVTAPAARAGGSTRRLLIVDLANATPAALAEGLDLGAYEAAQRTRRGGYSLEAVVDESEAEAEAARLRAAGLHVYAVPESTRHLSPWRAASGAAEGSRLRLRGDGSREIQRGDVLLVVRGPIVRERRPADKVKRIDTARLEPGHRFHLHLKDESTVVEIDPFELAFPGGAPLAGSSLLEVRAWVDAVRGDASDDEGFQYLSPALGVSEDKARAATVGLRDSGSGGKDSTPILDNLAQFRSYSGWRGAVERLRRG